MSGTISTLGVGSGLELQSILEQLRAVDQEVVDRKKNDVTELEAQLEEFTVVKNKLLTLKSSALDLSLSSNFLGRTISSSDETVLTATVQDGAAAQTSTVVAKNLAAQSSWMSSSGSASEDTIVYVPTSQESTTSVTDKDAAGFITTVGGDTLELTYGSGATMQTISVSVSYDDSMQDVADAITAATFDVTAEIYQVGSENFLRVKSAIGGSGEDERVMITDQLDDVTLSAPDKTFAYQLGDDNAAIISVAADTTLSGLVDLINADTDNPGATASIINDGIDPDAPYRLVLQADDSGEDSRISFLSQLPDLTMSENADQEVADSLNAQFSLDGISYQRQSNKITDVLTGVSFTIQGSGTSTISVDTNDDGIKDMINAMVDAYNDLIQEVVTNTSYDDETEDFGVLAGTTLRDLPQDLQALMTSINRSDSEGEVESLFALGLEFNRDGSISINQTTLDSAIADNRSSVEAFFLGDSDNDIEGFADSVNDRVRFMTGGSGMIEGERTSARNRIDSFELKIETDTARLDKKYEILTKQFINLDRYMNQMTSMSTMLNNTFSSLVNSSSKSSS